MHVPEPPAGVRHRARAQVPAAHPCLAGHFPGNPVVPAVVMLDLVLDAVHAWLGPQWRLGRLVVAKFLAPLRPDDPVDLELTLTGTRVDFLCARAGTVLAHGTMEQAP